MVNLGLNLVLWILGLAGEHDADSVLQWLSGLFYILCVVHDSMIVQGQCGKMRCVKSTSQATMPGWCFFYEAFGYLAL